MSIPETLRYHHTAHDLSRGLIVLILCFFIHPAGFSQEDDSLSVSKSIKSFLGLHHPDIGILTQMSAYAYNKDSRMIFEGEGNRFQISLGGDITNKLSYLAKGSFLNSYQLLDLKFSYHFRDFLAVDFGRMKTIFGREYIQSDAKLLFVRRSNITAWIGPQRQDGLQLRGELFDKRLSYAAGVWGGNGISSTSSTASLVTGKLAYTPIKGETTLLEIGASIAYTDDPNDFQENDVSLYYANSRKFLDGDFKLTIDNYRIESEYLIMTGSTRGKPNGFYINVANRLSDEFEAGVRFDMVEYPPFFYGPGPYYYYRYEGFTYRYYTAGINWFLEEDVELQLDVEREPLKSFTRITLLFQYNLEMD